MDIEESSCIRRCLVALFDHLEHFSLLLRQQLWTAASDSALATRGLQSHPSSFSKHSSLELRERPNHLHHHSACWRRGVDRLCKVAEARLRLLNPLHDRQHISQGSRKPVQLPDDEHVSFTEMIEQALDACRREPCHQGWCDVRTCVSTSRLSPKLRKCGRVV
jgi:hypothetical protein